MLSWFEKQGCSSSLKHFKVIAFGHLLSSPFFSHHVACRLKPHHCAFTASGFGMAGSNGPGKAVHTTMDGAKMEVLAAGDPKILNRPCIDCGLITGRFCDFCLAKDRFPKEVWADGQPTPLCSHCDNKHGECHRCRGMVWVTSSLLGQALGGRTHSWEIVM